MSKGISLFCDTGSFRSIDFRDSFRALNFSDSYCSLALALSDFFVPSIFNQASVLPKYSCAYKVFVKHF